MRMAVLVFCAIAVTPFHMAYAQKTNSTAAQNFPVRPIRIVVSTSAGSSPDLIARAVGREAERYLGQTLIVDNRTGANGIIASTIVAHAAPDGYTVLHTSPGIILNTLVNRNLQYDLQ